MNRTVLAATMLIAMSAQAAFANSPIDNQIKAAVYDIDRAEKQVISLSANQAAKLKRINGMIESAQSQLDASPNQQDPSWMDAKSRLDAIIARISEVMQPPAPSPAAVTTPAATQAAAVAQPSVAATSDLPSEADMALLGSLERQLDGFVRQMNEFSVPDYTRLQPQLESRIAQYKQMYMKLQNPQHPVAIAVAQKVLNVESHIQQQITTLAAQENALGDVKTRVTEISERHNINNRSWEERQLPSAPYTAELIRTFAQKLVATRTIATEDLQYLESVNGKTTQVDNATMREAIRRVTSELGRVDRDADSITERMEQLLAGHDQINTYIKKVPVYRVEDEVAGLQEGLSLLDRVNELNAIMGREPVSTDERQARYNSAINELYAKADAAVDQARFPEIRSNNPDLLAAAEEVLSRKEYSVNPISRMGITYDMQRKHVTEGDIDWGAVSTTVTVTGYEWDEFAVTTVEQVDGQYYLYYNLFKFFHTGGTDVPTGKWTLGERRQGIRILQENINS